MNMFHLQMVCPLPEDLAGKYGQLDEEICDCLDAAEKIAENSAWEHLNSHRLTKRSTNSGVVVNND